MEKLLKKDYLDFISHTDTLEISGVKLPILKGRLKKNCTPQDFKTERTTMWSFPERGTWATHEYNSKFRGNWAPQVARNLLLLYSKEGDTILDPFVGSGTTVIEAKILGRNGIGVDINRDIALLAYDRIIFKCKPDIEKEGKIKLYIGDARKLDKIKDSSIDFIATHPPYAGIIRYSNEKIPEDLSNITSPNKFVREFIPAIEEFYRVLKPNSYCAVLIGDTRKRRHIVPLGYMVMREFLNVGFMIKEHIIKAQHNMKGTRERWGGTYDFLLIGHEHLFVFRKPEK